MRPHRQVPALGPPTPRDALDLLALLLLGFIALLGFYAAYGTWAFLVPGGGGLVLGLLVGYVARRRGAGLVALAAATLTVFFALGGPLALPETTIAGVLPGLQTLRQLASSAVNGWVDLLTVAPPAGRAGGLFVVPYLAGLLVGVAGSTVLRRSPPSFLAILPSGVLLATGILFGDVRAVAPLVQGAAFAAAALSWLASRGALSAPSGSRRPSRQRIVAGAVLVTVALAGGSLVGPLLPTASSDTRVVLRDYVTPPFDVRQYPSPLNGLRRYLKEEKDLPLFTLQGVPTGTRIRLAALDTYDGVVWSASAGGTGTDRSGVFYRVGDRLAAPSGAARATMSVVVQNYRDRWVPNLGGLISVAFDPPRGQALDAEFRYNQASQTGVLPILLQKGDRYQLTATLPPARDEARLRAATTTSVALPPVSNVPEPLKSRAVDLVGSARGPYEQAVAIERALSEGYYSSGLAGQVPSRAGHGADRLVTFLAGDQLVGDEEQYAATMALMARQLGLPARVVMGFRPNITGTGPVVVKGQDVTAWVEIAFEGIGWVAFDPTPDRSRAPKEQLRKPTTTPRPQVQQPPPPPERPRTAPPAESRDTGESTKDRSPAGSRGLSRQALLVAGAGGTPLLAALLFVSLVFWLKRRRRQRRRRQGSAARRIAGGWAELMDFARDLGRPLRRAATRRETAQELAEPHIGRLAEYADLAVFGPSEPVEAEVGRYWQDVDRAIRELTRSLSLARRLRVRMSLTSLRGR